MRHLPFLLLAILVAAPAEARKPRDVDAKDPNKVICRTEEVIGSRLASKRTCMTAQQWEDMRREQRTTVDRIQAFKPQQGS